MRKMFPGLAGQGRRGLPARGEGGYANNMASMRGLAAKAQEAGARLVHGRARHRVRRWRRSGASHRAHRPGRHRGRAGRHQHQTVDRVSSGNCSGCPTASTCARRRARSAGTSTCGRSGTAGGRDPGRPGAALAARRSMPPLLHVDSDAPLYDDEGHLITDELWGNYLSRTCTGPGRRRAGDHGHEYEVDPYPTATFVRLRRHVVRVAVALHRRFAGERAPYADVRSAATAASPPTAPRCSTTWARTCMRSPTPTMATR